MGKLEPDVVHALALYNLRLASTRPADLEHALEPQLSVLLDAVERGVAARQVRADISSRRLAEILLHTGTAAAHTTILRTGSESPDDVWAFCLGGIRGIGLSAVEREYEGASVVGSLEGRVAVVTGASRGIGRGIAQRLAAEGALVAVTARTLHAGDGDYAGSLEETVDDIQSAGGRAVAVVADLADVDADRSAIVQAARDAVRRTGRDPGEQRRRGPALRTALRGDACGRVPRAGRGECLGGHGI